MISSDDTELVVRFVTKDQQYAIPITSFNVNGKSTGEEFDNIIKALLAEQNEELRIMNDVEFDFLINNKLVRSSIKEFIDNEKISAEKQVEIEYFAKTKPPEPHNSFLHDDWVSSVDTCDNWILSGCYDCTAHIWDVKTGEHKIAIPAHSAPIKAVRWAPKSSTGQPYCFVTCSHDETSMIWKWDSKLNRIEHLYTYIGHSRSVDCVAVNNDLVATGSYDRMLKIWSLIESDANNDGKNTKLRSPVITLEGHKEAITGCTWIEVAPENPIVSSVVTVSLDNCIKIWDVELGEQKQTLTSNKSLLDVAHSPLNGLLVTASCDRHIRLWDPRQNEGNQVRNAYSSHSGWVSSVAWSKLDDNLFISASYDNVVKEWDIRSPSAPLYDMLGHQDKVLAVNWSNHKFIVSGAADNQIKVFTNK